MAKNKNRNKNKWNSNAIVHGNGAYNPNAKRKDQSSSPTSTMSPPHKNPRMEELSSPTTTPTQQSGRQHPVATASSIANASFATSTPSTISSSMTASILSNGDPLPPEEVVALLSSPITNSTTVADLNLQPVIDQLYQTDLKQVSKEGKIIVQSIAKLLKHSLLTATKAHEERFRLKDIQVAMLTAKNTELMAKITSLENRMSSLESHVKSIHHHLDDVDQYERRDTVIISGNDLPEETATEAAAEVALTTLNRTLDLNLNMADINVAHRLGRKNNRKRPIIIKLHSRTKKSLIIKRCISKRPQLYVNESLTPSRRRIYSKLLVIRKNNPGLIQQLHTNDGNIFIRIQGAEDKFQFTNEESLFRILENFPILFGAYSSLT